MWKIILLLICIAIGVSAEEKVVKIGIFDWKPYSSATLENRGMLTEITIEALKATGYRVEYKEYPFARLLVYLGSGELDAAIGVSSNEERLKAIDFSASMFDVDYGFFYKKSKIKCNSIKDLKGFKGGVLLGSFWEKILAKEGITFEAVSSQDQNINKMKIDRIDFVAVAKDVGNYLMKSLLTKKEREEITFTSFKSPEISNEMPLAISKKTKNSNLKSDFEKGLEIIKENGTYNKIIEKDY